MDLVNSTPIPAVIYVSGDDDNAPRTAIVVAKATFRMEGDSKVALERDEPFPIFVEDHPTDLGLQPRDNLPKVDPTFEVLLLGRAHAPGGKPVSEMKVALTLGVVRREIVVIGDRVWEGEGKKARPSRPAPFQSMPLVFERAFGGRAEVLIDVESPVEVVDPLNPDGKGFNHVEQARNIGQIMKSPKGFPRYETTRELPNLEDPNHRIRRWEDSQVPTCWACAPLHSGMLAERLRRKQEANPDRVLKLGEPEMLHRAHPDWIIETPPAGQEVVLEGLTAEGIFGFRLPELKVVCDLQLGEETRSLELVPRTLMLLPEDRKFYIVYRQFFQFTYRADETRVVRVREEEGWTLPPRGES